MEAAASIAAFVSLSIQVGDSVKKLSDFLGSAAEAPNSIRRLLDDLDALRNILEIITNDIEDAPLSTSFKELFRQCLATCNYRSQNVTAVVDDLDQAFSRTGGLRRWTSLKAAFRKNRIKEFRDQLESAMHMLSLAVQSFSYRVQRYDARLISQIHQNVQLLITDKNHSTSSLVTFPHCLQDTVVNQSPASDGPLQDITKVTTSLPTHRKIHPFRQRQWYSSTQYLLTPFDLAHAVLRPLERSLPWHHTNVLRRSLCSLSSTSGLTYVSTTYQVTFATGCSQETKHIEHSYTLTFIVPFLQRGFALHWVPRLLRISRIVPETSPIFDICRNGDVQTMELFFAKGWATPQDRTPHGYTLLHAASRLGQAQMCKILLMYGVDVNSEDACLGTPFDELQSSYLVDFYLKSFDGVFHHEKGAFRRGTENSIDTLRAFLQHGFDPMDTRSRRRGDVFFGSYWSSDVYKWIIDQDIAQVDLGQRDRDEQMTPLMWLLNNYGFINYNYETDEGAIIKLLKAGVDVHAISKKGFTSLDCAIWGNCVDIWLQLLSQTGYDLHPYLLKERELHGGEHVSHEFIVDLRIGRLKLVRYHCGAPEKLCGISLEDYDALEWFNDGLNVLDIFSDSDTVFCGHRPLTNCQRIFDRTRVSHFFCGLCRESGKDTIRCGDCVDEFGTDWCLFHKWGYGRLIKQTREEDAIDLGSPKTTSEVEAQQITKPISNVIYQTLISCLRLEPTAAAIATSINLRWIYGLSVLFLLRYFSLKLMLYAIIVAYTVQYVLLRNRSEMHVSEIDTARDNVENSKGDLSMLRQGRKARRRSKKRKST